MTLRAPAVLLVILLAGCGGSESSSGTATAPPATTSAAGPRDVCGMLTMDELKTAAGLQEATGQSSKSGGADVCTWMGAGGKAVVVQVFGSASDYDSGRSSFEGLYNTKAEEVSGIGEKAYYLFGKTGPMNTGTLVAAKGSTPISVQVMGSTGDAATMKGEATAIAHVILGKL